MGACGVGKRGKLEHVQLGGGVSWSMCSSPFREQNDTCAVNRH